MWQSVDLGDDCGALRKLQEEEEKEDIERERTAGRLGSN